MLQLESGTGKPPPMLSKVQAEEEVYNFRADGSPELVGKPFQITKREDGSFSILANVQSQGDLTRIITHIAAEIGCSEEAVLRSFEQGKAKFKSRRPSVIHFRLSFGQVNTLRSIVKSLLVLWSTVVGNEEVRSSPYAEARRFVNLGDNFFNERRMRLDPRRLPCEADLQVSWGDLFNLLYVKSNDMGQVVGHFTLYNAVAWSAVLADEGGTPNISIGLVSNPLNPSKWSDKIDNIVCIDFDWLNDTALDDDCERSHERFGLIMEQHFDAGMEREIGRIVKEVFTRRGISENELVAEELWLELGEEISERVAKLATNIPYERPLTPDEVQNLLKPKST